MDGRMCVGDVVISRTTGRRMEVLDVEDWLVGEEQMKIGNLLRLIPAEGDPERAQKRNVLWPDHWVMKRGEQMELWENIKD